ncbi:hypothetical protein [Schaalia sp. Marseille-Q2122]|uniref:AMIN-like domain-containing (lipo)protein n=1 Tax=Schaalia sp. Marseille-Q2122 TaxID=2736604 RepID=UPI00158C5637|nr:hypothetical protein [Schaalia sp. Marseille-Q2122]
MSTHRYTTARVLSGLLAVGVAATMVAACTAPGTNGSSGAAEPAFKANELSGGDAPQSIPTYTRKVGENLDPIGGGEEAWTLEVGARSIEDSAVPSSLVFHDVRVGEHADFYRVVLEFKKDPSVEATTDQADAWDAELAWVDAPVTLGKGDAMESEGKAFLDVTVGRTVMASTPELEELYFAGAKSVKIGPLEVLVDGTVEDKTHVVISMDEQHPVQTGFLTRPARLVIDVKK